MDTSILIRIVLGVEFDIVQFSHYFAIFKLPCCKYYKVICVGQFICPCFKNALGMFFSSSSVYNDFTPHSQ
jgi:hypothetical protein